MKALKVILVGRGDTLSTVGTERGEETDRCTGEQTVLCHTVVIDMDDEGTGHKL